ncbi:hypothetical protein SNE40_008274 [Patella caerulea]|uniref:Uncharacterized protein n=1 Tax=Patella caerulea TaxID=87958 RepID=A0AAN8K0Z5_PATCE
MSAVKRSAAELTPSSYDSPSKIKKLEPVFRTPLTYSPRVIGSASRAVSSPLRTEHCKLELRFTEFDTDVNETNVTCSDEEYSANLVDDFTGTGMSLIVYID